MTDQAVESWFDEAQREGAPSANFKELGNSVYGEVVDQFIIDYVPFNETEPARDKKTGEVIKQLVVVLQTDQRGWAGVAKIPTNRDGSPKDPSLDDGKRAVYLRKFTNIYSALGEALKKAKAKNVQNGGKLGIQFFDEEDTGKGNPLKKFRAKYEPPAPAAASDDFFGGQPAQAEPQTPPAQSASPAQQDPWSGASAAPQAPPAPSPQVDDEPPF